MGSLVNKARIGAALTCLLLLPLPLVAYTISTWSFANHGVALSDITTNHKALTYSGASGGPNFNSTATSTITGTVNEAVMAHLDLQGMNITVGTLTVTITVGSQSHAFVFTGSNPMADWSGANGFTLTSTSAPVTVKFQFSSNASFTYNSTSQNQLVFR
jgi:hypothetical protein